MARSIRRQPRVRSLLELRHAIEVARDDMSRAAAELAEAEQRLQRVRLYLGTAQTYFATIVDLYNRLADDHRDELPRAPRGEQESDP